MHGAPAVWAALMPKQQFFERGLRFDDDGVRARIHQRRGLFVEGAAHLGFGEIAVGLQQAAKRTDVAEDVAVSAPKAWRAISTPAWLISTTLSALEWRLSMMREPPKVLVRMQSDAGLGIAALDGQHPLRMREVPCLAAVALLQSGQHQLRAHGAVAEQGPLPDRVLQKLLHGWSAVLNQFLLHQRVVNGFEHQAPLVLAAGGIAVAARAADGAPPRQDRVQALSA